jgi:hypothetical protein
MRPRRSFRYATLAAFVTLACGKMDPCGNEVISRVAAPGGRLEAIIFERDCGATTDFSTQVSVLPTNAEFLERPSFWTATQQGNVLVVDGDHGAAPAGQGGGPSVQATWKDDHTLILGYHPKARVFRVVESLEGIRILHQRLDAR